MKARNLGNNENEVLFIVKFELGDTHSDQIMYKVGDIVEELAIQFCERNQLGVGVYTTIVDALEEKYQTVQELNKAQYEKNRANKNSKNSPSQPKFDQTTTLKDVKSTGKKNKIKIKEQMSPGTLISNDEFQDQKVNDYNIYSVYNKSNLSPEVVSGQIKVSKSGLIKPGNHITSGLISTPKINRYNELEQDLNSGKNYSGYQSSLTKFMLKGDIHPKSNKKPNEDQDAVNQSYSGYNTKIKRVEDRLYSDAKSRQARNWNSKVAQKIIKQEVSRLKQSVSKSQILQKKRKRSTAKSVESSYDGDIYQGQYAYTKQHHFKGNKNIMNNTGISNSGVSASNRLYYGGIQHKQSKDRLNQTLESKKYLSESSDNLFRPQINDISRKIANTKKVFAGDNLKVEERLNKYGQAMEYKKQQIKGIKDEIEKGVCTFQPRLDNV